LEAGAIGCGSDSIPVPGGSIGIGAPTTVGDGYGLPAIEDLIVRYAINQAVVIGVFNGRLARDAIAIEIGIEFGFPTECRGLSSCFPTGAFGDDA